MKFYSINLLPLVDRSYAVIRDLPQGTIEYGYRMARGLEMGDRYPANASVHMDPRMPGIKLPSLVANTCALLIVSAPVKNCLEKASQSKIEYLPLAIYNHKKKLASRDYFIINPLGTFDCLNPERSEIEYNNGDIVQLKKPVLDGKKLKHAPDLFRLPENPELYIISERLAASLKEIKATNIYLFELEQDSGKPDKA